MKNCTFSQYYLSDRPAWTPYQLQSQVSLWLDASVTSSLSLSGSSVTQWNSLLGGVNVVQATGANQPVYSATGFNGRPCVDWGNAVNTRFLQTDSTITFAHVWFMVRYSNGSAASWLSNNPTIAQGETNANASTLLASGTGTTTWSGAVAMTGNLNGGTVAGLANSAAFPFPESLWGGYKNVAYTDTVNIGRHSTATPRNWWGPIAEVLMLSTRASEGDRQRVEGYMMWKWGLQANLPVGHPYKSAPPLVA
jgi:hypothetical protein